MKKLRPCSSLRSRGVKSACTVSAAALMLGVSHAAVVGLNFQVGWDDVGSHGYTGFPVTATAFGIPPASWENLTPMPTGYSGSAPGSFSLNETIDTTTATGGLNPLPSGSLSVSWAANAANTSAFGIDDPTPYASRPNQPHRGEQEVYYGFLRDNLFIYTTPSPVIPYSVTISGLHSVFTNPQHAYVVRTAASTDSGKIFTNAIISSLTTTTMVSYAAVFTDFYDSNPNRNIGIMGGLSSASAALTDDSITIGGAPAYDGPNGMNNYNTGAGTDTGPGIASAISGVMITDRPIIVYSPATPASLCAGDSATLTVDAFGVPPLSYQWRKNGVPIAGATGASYAVNKVDASKAGIYDVVVANAYGSATSASAAIAASGLLLERQANIIHDTKPVGPEQNALNNGATWLASSSDGVKTRSGVLAFSGTNYNQVTLSGATNLQSPAGAISFWMRSAGTLTDSPEISPGAMIFTGGDWNDTDQKGISIVQSDDGTVYVGDLSVTGGSLINSGSPAFLNSTATVSDNNWHLITLDYDQSTNGGLGLYIDGLVDGTNANTGGWTWPAGSAQKIALGLSHKTNWRPYDGQLNDVRIYNRILSAVEIAQIFATDAIVDNNALQLRLSFSAAPTNGFALNWTCGTTLESSGTVQGPYTVIAPASSPWVITASQLQQFYLIK